MDLVEQKQAKRFVFLKWVYELSGGEQTLYELKYLLNNSPLDPDDAHSAAKYLAGEGLLSGEFDTYTGLTHEGIKEIESVQGKPDQATEHFPAGIVNNITVNGNITGSTFQQAGVGSTQTATINTNDIRGFIAALKASIKDLGLDEGTEADLVVDVETMDTQLRRSSPKSGIVSACLVSIRTVLEGAAGNLVASGLLERLNAISF